MSDLIATESPQMSQRCLCYLFYVLLYFLTMGIVREQYSKCHSRHFFIYACAVSSEWGLFSLSRSAWSPRPPSLFEAKSLLASPHSEYVPSHSFRSPNPRGIWYTDRHVSIVLSRTEVIVQMATRICPLTENTCQGAFLWPFGTVFAYKLVIISFS